MKMYGNEKTLGFQRMILFIELFANVKRSGFFYLHLLCELLKKTKKIK